MPTTSFRLGVVLLAAGASSRMGCPKMLLPWGRTSILGHHLDVWRRLGAAQVAAVYSTASAGLVDELNRLNVPARDRIPNAAPEQGMFSSIRAAAAWSGWTPELTHWAIVLGDQPHV